MNLFTKKQAPVIEAPAPAADPIFSNPADEKCGNPKCPKFITEKHTPKAVIYCGLTFCEESCVPPSLREKDRLEKQQTQASREVAAREAKQLAKANRIVALRNQIAYCEEHKSALEAAGVDFALHLKTYTDALQLELAVPDLSPHKVIPLEANHQFV